MEKPDVWLQMCFYVSVLSAYGICATTNYTLYKKGNDIVIPFKKTESGSERESILEPGIITNNMKNISCYVQHGNNKTVLVKWHDGPVMTNTCRGRCKVNLNEFRLIEANLNDTGRYECDVILVRAGEGTTVEKEFVYAIVTDSEVKPTISMNATLVPTGWTVKLTCDTHSLANYSVKVSWKKNGLGSRYKNLSRMLGHEILLENVTSREAGFYRCEMYNVMNSKSSDAQELIVVPAGYTMPTESTERPSIFLFPVENASAPINAELNGPSTMPILGGHPSLNKVAIVCITALAAIVISVITARVWKAWRKGKHNTQDLRVQMKPLQALEDLRRPSQVSNGPGSPTSVVYATIDDDLLKSDLKPEADTGHVISVLSTYVLSSGDSFEVISEAAARDSEVIHVGVNMVDMCENPIYVHSEETSCDAKKAQPAKQDVFMYDHIGGLNLPASSRTQRGVSPTRGLETRSEKEAGREEEDIF